MAKRDTASGATRLVDGTRRVPATLMERLRDPLQLRMVITGVMLAVAYVGINMPLASRIEEAAGKLDKEQKRKALAADIEQLRAEVQGVEARLPEDTDTNEWAQFLLGGVRDSALKLATLKPDGPQRVGPYEAVVFHLELEGTFRDLDAFLHWIESNQRLFRVDAARIAQPRDGGDRLLMQLTLLGLKR
jgi:type II secretory pathway component PulM